jgi:hypothetical protein
MKTWHQTQKQQAKKEKEIFTYKSAALIEFIEFANNGGIWRRIKICYNILFKRIKIVHGKPGKVQVVSGKDAKNSAHTEDDIPKPALSRIKSASRFNLLSGKDGDGLADHIGRDKD